MKTRFHSSIKVGSPEFTNAAASALVLFRTWSKCISVHGPQGPTEPMSQKLSFWPNSSILSAGTLETSSNTGRSRVTFASKRRI